MPIPNLSQSDFQDVLSKVPVLLVDIVIINRHQVLLVKRGYDPFKGYWHLPGGFVWYNETIEQAMSRVVKDETGLDLVGCHFIGVYDLKDRDPRGHLVSLSYVGQVGAGTAVARDGEEVRWVDIEDVDTYQPFLWFHKDPIIEGHKLVNGGSF